MSTPSPAGPPPPRRAWIPAAAVLALVVAYLVVRDIGVPIYDDGYFFKRFALHGLEHGMLAWNVEDGPVHGCTSQGFLLVAILCTALSHTHYVAVVKVVSALSLVGLGALLVRWCSRATGPAHRGGMVALLGLGSPLVLTTALTGMETAVTLLGLALALVALFDPEGTLRASPTRAALITAGVYLLRPDVALVPALAFVVHSLVQREFPARYLGILAATMLALLVGLWIYYGTPLPLAFFTKTAGLQPYGPHMAALALQDKIRHFGAALLFGAPLLALAIHRRDATNLALLAAGVGLWAYHLALTHEIMGYRGRFYVPGLVPMMMAAARGHEAFHASPRRPLVLGGLALFVTAIAVAYLRGWVPTVAGDYHTRIPAPSYVGLALGSAWLLWPRADRGPRIELGVMGLLVVAAVLGWKQPTQFRLRSDAQLLRINMRHVTTFRGLPDVARCLPDARAVYHSEMGVAGLVLYRTRLVDLVGILSEHRLWGEPFDFICERDRPEAIFLPHRNYRRLNLEIRASDCFADYRRVVEKSASPLYVREDLADSFLECASDVHRW